MSLDRKSKYLVNSSIFVAVLLKVRNYPTHFAWNSTENIPNYSGPHQILSSLTCSVYESEC